MLVDIIIGFITVCISLGSTMFAQFKLYQKQQKELEEARTNSDEANKAKSTFLANMSHEIRTPIHIILSMNEIIRRENHSYQVHQCSEKIDEASKMLLSLVDNVLDVSKIESGKMELLPETYNSKELLDTISLIGHTRCEKKQLFFRMKIENDLPENLYGDLSRIKQIVGNLISNAAKYTKQGGINISISHKESTKDDEIILCISVQDTGIGIRKTAIPTLFNAFVRADLLTHRDIEGTGLGLAIVKFLTELMGGSITVQSEYGKGSIFSIEIPQKILCASDTCDDSDSDSFHAPDCHILVVDDNETNRSIMLHILSETMIQTDTAESGEECIDLVQKKDYHLILMDYMMPGLNGLDTLNKLKALPGFHTPVAVLTANAVAGMENELLQAGFAAYITKPIPYKKLKKLLLSFLPPELIIPVEKTEQPALENFLTPALNNELLNYGISIEHALDFFQGNLSECVKTAELFLRYNSDDVRKAHMFYENGDYTSLKYIVHALKGKAKNMGAEKLSSVSRTIESLCTADTREEAESLMPYLFYNWKQFELGLNYFVENINIKKTHSAPDVRYTPEECEKLLPDYLTQLCRKPSLECLQTLIQEESSSYGKDLLESVRNAVSTISFDEASIIFDEYLKWKRGTK